MRYGIVFMACVLSACAEGGKSEPSDGASAFVYREIQTKGFKLASWQKLADGNRPVKIYIEGDGRAFDANGFPTLDPTPGKEFFRKIAFSDPSANVAYLARPCQFVADEACGASDWTVGRFSEKAVASTAEAVLRIADGREVILVGYSGGAQMAGIVAVLYPEIKVKKMITLAGNLDVRGWTGIHRLNPLTESLDLRNERKTYLSIPQIHYVGTKDGIVPPELTVAFVGGKWPVIDVRGAGHDRGFESVYPLIWAEE